MRKIFSKYVSLCLIYISRVRSEVLVTSCGLLEIDVSEDFAASFVRIKETVSRSFRNNCDVPERTALHTNYILHIIQ